MQKTTEPLLIPPPRLSISQTNDAYIGSTPASTITSPATSTSSSPVLPPGTYSPIYPNGRSLMNRKIKPVAPDAKPGVFAALLQNAVSQNPTKS